MFANLKSEKIYARGGIMRIVKLGICVFIALIIPQLNTERATTEARAHSLQDFGEKLGERFDKAGNKLQSFDRFWREPFGP